MRKGNTVPSGFQQRRLVLAILGVLMLGLVINAGFALALNRVGTDTLLSPTAIESDQLILATNDAAGNLFTANRSNEITQYQNLNASQSTAFEKTIGALAPLPDGSMLVGTADGVVSRLGSDLHVAQTVKVDGRVLALAGRDDGFYVAHGVGAFGVRFYISFFKGNQPEPAFTFQVAQPITAMSSFGDGVVYGTKNSTVGYLTPASPEKPVWTQQEAAPISRVQQVSSSPEDGILVGNERGEVTLLDASGAPRWTTTVGQYAIRGLNFDGESGQALVGDAHGNLAILNEDGSSVFSGSLSTDSDVEALLHSGAEGWIAIPRSGTWQALDPAAASGAASAQVIGRLWIVGNVAYVLVAASVMIAVVDRWQRSARRLGGQIWRGRIAYLFIFPAVALIIIFSYYPGVLAFYYSFTSYSLRSVTEFIGFDNYRTILFHDDYFRTGLKNMAIITIASVIKTLTIPLLIAELIFWLRNATHSYIFRTLFILPTVVPGLVFTLMWRQVYDPDTGLLNSLLGAVGLEQFQRAWLGDEHTALWAILGVGFPWVDAFALLILLGGLLNINADYFDASKVDGAGTWARFRHVDLPLLLPQFRILLFFAITGTIQGFVSIFILTKGGPGMTTYIPSLQMYLRIADGDFGYASAVGVILFLFILIATFVVLRLRRNDGVEAA